MPTIETAVIPPLFRAVCGEDGPRYVLAEPWTENGYLYATDGRIAIRRPEPDLIRPPRGRVPRVAPLFAAGPWSKIPRPIPDPGEPEWEHCGTCKDGHHVCLCPDCDGDLCSTCGGEQVVPCAADHPGAFLCNVCDGESPWEQCRPLVVGVVPGSTSLWYISSRYARLLRQHGIREIQLPRTIEEPAYFRLGNIEGLVMGIKR